jgi:deoxyribose-phosphate aldolase
MTNRYTDEEWTSQIAEAQKAVPNDSDDTHPTPITASSDLAQCIDHTLLNVDATEEQIDNLCSEAKEWNFKVIQFL